MCNVLLVEDDLLWKAKLQVMLDEIGITIQATATNLAEVKEATKKHLPDVIIADVLLGTETFFDIYKTQPHLENIPTIFITVSDKEIYFNKAHKLIKHFYLVKPVHILTLKSVLESIYTNSESKSLSEKYLPIKGSKNEHIKLPFSHIVYLEQQANYCYVNTPQKQFTLKKSLHLIGQMLDDSFLQIHRSFIINTLFIENFTVSLSSVKLKSGVELPIGRINRDKVREYLASKLIKEI